LRWDGHLAAEIYAYVDDCRVVGFCRDICWAGARRLASMCTKYGVQDKTAKRTFPTPTPGPWAGTVSHTDEHEVAGLVSVGKWAKTHALVQELADLVASSGERGLPRQRLLEIRGFLNYVVRTYPWMNPYLKGLHLTIDGWREGRTEGGWRPTGAVAMAGRRAYDAEMEGRTGIPAPPPDEGPEFVEPQPRLRRDVSCLLELTAGESPPGRSIKGADDAGLLRARGCQWFRLWLSHHR
jgi:hypothetical protein